jgi:NADPH:quinone reductase-like Zn-dependent oxidoreductase
MKAVVFERAGNPGEVLRVAEIPPPKIGDGQVLVRVDARPVQPADLFFIRGQYRIKPKFVQVAGLEGAGVVLDSGRSAIRAGTRVAFRWPGTWAELAAIPAERLIRIPDEVPNTVACQISLNPVTAWALLDEVGVSPGDWVVITAGASTVSRLVAAIARHRGVHVIGVVRANAAEGARRSPADLVLSVQDSGLIERISRAAGDDKVAALLDSVGGPLIARLFSVLRPGARIVAYGTQQREPAQVTNAMLVYSNLTWMGFGIDRWLAALESHRYAEMLEDLWSMIRLGTMKLTVHSIHSLEHFKEALAADTVPDRDGKVLIGRT